jgi:hypothetical protein
MLSQATDQPATLAFVRKVFSGEGGLFRDAESPPWWLAFGLSLLVLAYKAPDSLSSPQFWAEDGAIFFSQQYGRALPALFVSYASYLHAVPRLVAWLATAFSAVHAPALYCYAAWILGACALTSLRHLRLPGVPFVVLLAGIALTPTNIEVFGTITNVQWLLQFYLISSLARLVHGTRSRHPNLRIALALIVGLTGPFVLFAVFAALSLVFLTHALKQAGKTDAAPMAWNAEFTAFAIAAAIQLICITTASSKAHLSSQPIDLKSVVRVISAVQAHSLGVELLPRVAFRWLLGGFSVLALVVAPDRKTRLLLLGIYAFLLLNAAAIVQKSAGDGSKDLGIIHIGDRYFVVIKALLVWMLALVTARWTARNLELRNLLFLVIAVGPSLLFGHFLQRPQLPDRKWADRAARFEQGSISEIEINPVPWRVRLEADAP